MIEERIFCSCGYDMTDEADPEDRPCDSCISQMQFKACDFVGCDEVASEVFGNHDESIIIQACHLCAEDIHHDIQTGSEDICTAEPMISLGEVD